MPKLVGCGFDSHLGYMREDILDRKNEILEWISSNESNSEIARRLGCKVDTLKVYYTKMGITYKGNQSMKGKKTDPKKKVRFGNNKSTKLLKFSREEKTY